MHTDSESPILPQLLALDWGTSSLRAFLMRDGLVVDSRARLTASSISFAGARCSRFRTGAGRPSVTGCGSGRICRCWPAVWSVVRKAGAKPRMCAVLPTRYDSPPRACGSTAAWAASS